jgi:epoxide hydrolase-like predicted phosphatase
MIKTIVFDIGGVVVQGPFAQMLLQNASEKLALEDEELKNILHEHEPALQRGEIDHLTFWKRALGERKHSDEVLSSLWHDPFVLHARRNEELISLIQSLKETYRVGCISNTQEPHVSTLRDMRILELFDPCVLSNEVQLRKPDQAIFHHYLRLVGCKPEEAVFIDDDQRNFVQAQAMGMHTILFENLAQLKEDLRLLGVSHLS